MEAVAFSPDNEMLASVSSARTLTLWDITSAQPRRIGPPLVGHSDWVLNVDFSPDGAFVATASADSSIVVWDIRLESWKRIACEVVRRNLTVAEWKLYLPQAPYHKTCDAYSEGQ